tara:strand:- start:270 stop:386 length:117 start_codon:yes stop_codon:yes gene_type:complete
MQLGRPTGLLDKQVNKLNSHQLLENKHFLGVLAKLAVS